MASLNLFLSEGLIICNHFRTIQRINQSVWPILYFFRCKIAIDKEKLLIHSGIRANPLTPFKSTTEAVLTSTHNLCFEKIKEHVTFHL